MNAAPLLAPEHLCQTTPQRPQKHTPTQGQNSKHSLKDQWVLQLPAVFRWAARGGSQITAVDSAHLLPSAERLVLRGRGGAGVPRESLGAPGREVQGSPGRVLGRLGRAELRLLAASRGSGADRAAAAEDAKSGGC